jgi:hypothetical protein
MTTARSLLFVVGLTLAGCSGSPKSENVCGCCGEAPVCDKPVQPPAAQPLTLQPGAAPVNLPGLEHVAELSPGVISGGEPQGESGYATLAAMGVKTVISVDAVPPPAEIARKLGIRVVHLPIGYDGVPEPTRLAMAKALSELDGPIYVHCHHGEHRGPAALVAGAVCAGSIDTQRALEFMTLTGVSKSYGGLWRDVEATSVVDPTDLHLMEISLPAQADIGGYAGAMALVSRANDRLKLVAANGWEVPDDHPDLAPGSDLGLIHNLLRSLRDDAESIAYGAEHGTFLEQSIVMAGEAEKAYKAGEMEMAAEAFKGLAASCKDCHTKYRN